MSRTPRERALRRLERGRRLLAVGAGSGLVAAAAERGGCDLVVVYNSGRFRTAGQSSLSGLLPFGDANAIVLELAREVVAAVHDVPVVAGVCATDPFRDLDQLLGELRALGVAGVQNFPTIGLFGAELRDDLEATGIHFEREVELMRAGRRLGLLTCAFVTTPADATRMALAGVDVLAPHLGVTRAAPGDALLAAAARIDAMTAAAREVRDDLPALFHGGPAASPGDVAQVLAAAHELDGFFAASAVERQPVERAVEDAVRAFVGPARAEPTAPDFSQPPPVLPVELTPETLPGYLREKGLVGDDEPVEVEELGGGLSNVVLGWRTGDRDGVVKQSRPRLRVADEWLADVRRALNEHDAIALLAERLGSGAIPALTFSDPDAMAFGMARAPVDALLWKPELLEGRLELERARQAGRLLREIHDCTRDDEAVAERFGALPLLDQTRLDPWYRAAAARHSDLAATMDYAIERVLTVRRVLVHGDFVPKNMLLLDRGLLLLDYEVVHYGNPGYDVATFINHMLLKGLRFGEWRTGFVELARAFWSTYAGGLAARDRELAEQETVVQLGALMLARIDGKSKVEYLVDHPGAEAARTYARYVLRTRPGGIEEALDAYRRQAMEVA